MAFHLLNNSNNYQPIMPKPLDLMASFREKDQSAKFEELDVNNDGKVTRDELTQGLLGSGDRSTMNLMDQLKAEQMADFALQKYDLDGDGAISVYQSVKRQERIGAQEMKRYDTDGDGRVTSAEINQTIHDSFLSSLIIGQFDLDHDGAINVGPGEPPAQPDAHAILQPALSAAEALKQQEQQGARHLKYLDRDGDGRVTLNELERSIYYNHAGAGALSYLASMDLDHDGAIDVGK